MLTNQKGYQDTGTCSLYKPWEQEVGGTLSPSPHGSLCCEILSPSPGGSLYLFFNKSPPLLYHLHLLAMDSFFDSYGQRIRGTILPRGTLPVPVQKSHINNNQNCKPVFKIFLERTPQYYRNAFYVF
uniref:Uncharacterized protein n=1 Tax=Myotis myotis TaxID=51298 RepID=A0A7J7XHK9_MYOMY|nr:hypothetical protein mMyoMyo1_011668 [Myotis myotis]